MASGNGGRTSIALIAGATIAAVALVVVAAIAWYVVVLRPDAGEARDAYAHEVELIAEEAHTVARSFNEVTWDDSIDLEEGRELTRGWADSSDVIAADAAALKAWEELEDEHDAFERDLGAWEAYFLLLRTTWDEAETVEDALERTVDLSSRIPGVQSAYDGILAQAERVGVDTGPIALALATPEWRRDEERDDEPVDPDPYRTEVALILGERRVIDGEHDWIVRAGNPQESDYGYLAFIAGRASFLANRAREIEPPEGREETHADLLTLLDTDAEWLGRMLELTSASMSEAELDEALGALTEEMFARDYPLEAVYADLDLSEYVVVDALCREKQATLKTALDAYLDDDPDVSLDELSGDAWQDALAEGMVDVINPFSCPSLVGLYELDTATGEFVCVEHGAPDRPDPLLSTPEDSSSE